jgi:hypothetical protein
MESDMPTGSKPASPFRRPLVRTSELLALLLLLLVWAASVFVWPGVCWSSKSGTRFLGIGSGGVDVFRYPESSLPSGVVFSAPLASQYSVLWWPRRTTPIGGFGLSVPIWLLFPLPLLPGAFRFCGRALRPAYRCRNCAYDLRGLDSAHECPECGHSRPLKFCGQLRTEC